MASPDVPLVSATSEPARIRFFDAYRRLGEHPNTLQNCFLVSLGQVIPLFGQLVLLGYIGKVIRHQATRDEPWPQYHDFDDHNFRGYIPLGFKVVFANLFWGILISGVLMIPGSIVIVLADMMDGYHSRAFSTFAGLGVPLVTSLLLWVLTAPILLRVQLTGQLRRMFDFRSLPRYIRLVWPEQVMAYLFIASTGWLMIVLGLMLCGIGVLPALVIIGLAHADLQAQIYRLYLARGGEPIKEIPE